MSVRQLVTALENAVIDAVGGYGVVAQGRRDAPGVYVGGRKLASVGLRIRRGCCYHGIALNVSMDLEPFTRINPCGFQNLAVTQLEDLRVSHKLDDVQRDLEGNLALAFGAQQS